MSKHNLFTFEQVNFVWLLQKLSQSPKSRVLGCSVPLLTTAVVGAENTAVFKGLEQERDSFFSVFKADLAPSALLLCLKAQLKERDKQIYKVLTGKLASDDKNEIQQMQTEILHLLKLHYQDHFLVRYADGGEEKILTQEGLEKDWKNLHLWQTVQLLPINMAGNGRAFSLFWTAEGLDASYTAPVSYNRQQFLAPHQDSEDFLMKADPATYCQYVCTKVGFYLRQLYGIELLKMHAEFSRDDFGKVWFYFAKDVWVRRVNDFPSDYD